MSTLLYQQHNATRLNSRNSMHLSTTSAKNILSVFGADTPQEILFWLFTKKPPRFLMNVKRLLTKRYCEDVDGCDGGGGIIAQITSNLILCSVCYLQQHQVGDQHLGSDTG